MLSTTTLRAQQLLLARRSLVAATTAPTSALHRHLAPSVLRSLSTSRPAFAIQEPLRSSSSSSADAPASEAKEPTRSFQPHFKDAAPPLPTTPEQVQQWRSSRPHENWVMDHPVYKPDDLVVDVVHLEPKTFSDKLTYGMVRFARWGFDFVSGYKHASPEAAMEAAKKNGKGNLTVPELVKEGYLMSEKAWMARILYLESIAGVPGFTAAILRHLRSLRLMKRDGGWVNTLLQEAENERMHLLTFMKIRDPSAFFRLLVLATQGVFFNLFFVSYMLSPQAAHRFVGYLEEEACKTYTHIIGAIERGEIPEWDPKNPNSKKVPQVAKDYWRLPDDATMLDLVKAVRADEAGHRFTNHTLANLKREDFNPVALMHASPATQGTTTGFTREQSLEFAKKVQEEMTGRKPKVGDEKEL
ncbi:hypothetical protein JCM6882_005870 [Rhodosporidiobolus microsporus]